MRLQIITVNKLLQIINKKLRFVGAFLLKIEKSNQIRYTDTVLISLKFSQSIAMKPVNKIKILPQHEAIKIAAGEVVERPINIIKEVVENSIDAGATKITITIHQAGKLLIKITDNGCGMSPDDAKLSVAQHATSKINKVEDLETIATFGFRGEALASINSVSNVTITTKTEDAQTGTLLAWNFGKLIEESMQSHQTGTTLEIANLFDNIPARQKFLKKDETEWRAIVMLFQAFCLDYQSIHFQLYDEHKLHFNCPPATKIIDRAAQLFDANFHSKMINLAELTNNLCNVTGIISNQNYYRYDRNQIFIFVNSRWVKNVDLSKAIMRGYAGLLPPQKFPAAVIFITLPADQVDVNIHPKKEEVKFLHPKKIETVIVNSIKATLESSTSAQLKASSAEFRQSMQQPAPFSFLQKQSYEKSNNNQEDFHASTNDTVFKESNYTINSQTQQNNQSTHTNVDVEPTYDNSSYAKATADATFFTPPAFAAHAFQAHVTENISAQKLVPQPMQNSMMQDHHEVAIIGQYKTTYILFEKDNNLVFVDQHAAHERILYEQFKVNFCNIATIQLIFPEFIKLSAADIQTIIPYLSLLHDHGITAEIFSDTQLMIQATPVHLKNQLLQETVQQIISWIHESDETDATRISLLLNEKIHTKMACSAAIKAGEKLNMQQMQKLLDDLSKIEHRQSCPHGRPTFWVLPIDDVEKKFKRDYGKKAEQFYDFLS